LSKIEGIGAKKAEKLIEAAKAHFDSQEEKP
jgi:Holliday junction resolvasome RuvABC DNA-binding subunit